MRLLISDRAFGERQRVASTALAPLAVSLAADLRAVIDRPLYVPEQKAILSREGGRCPNDGTMLDFDPFSPIEHRCPKCDRTWNRELDHRFWIYWYQLWLAERAVQGALLGRLGVEPKGIAFANSVLDAYADRYLSYPNVDNALGPTRPFFSTYLESIWLLQLCVALDLLGDAAGATGHRAIDRIVEPSRELIASFDEGMSNRQVWNNAALMAAARLVDDGTFEEEVWAESGLATHLGAALLADGTWYEGENYHLFAHRGLWYGVTMAEQAGVELPSELVARFNTAFGAPFLSALPDFTLPSRRDSQYAISLRQWRFAEMCELGLARHDDRTLTGALARIYADDIPRTQTGRWASAAEVERNLPPTQLARADLNWKSLLCARPTVELSKASAPRSVLLESQGLGIIRRDSGRVYVALDYGRSGGGHGHPDRLNLLLMDGETRWLDDYGTGSYVEQSLHWYRSTLAHNAPMIGLRTQRPVDGEFLAYEDRGAAGWMSATAAIDDGARVRRDLVVMPDYLLDTITWTGQEFALPLHIDARGEFDRKPPGFWAHSGIDEGFRHVRDLYRVASIAPGEKIRLTSTQGEKQLDLWLGADTDLDLLEMTGPAAPGRGLASFLLVRSKAGAGVLRSLYSWRGTVTDADLGATSVVVAGPERHEIKVGANAVGVVIHAGEARSSIDFVRPDEALEEETETFSYSRVIEGEGEEIESPIEIHLGRESYVRSEQSWEEAGRPSADISISAEADSLTVTVDVENVDRTFTSDTRNRLDNEPGDINGAGIQFYLRNAGRVAGYVMVPELGSSHVHARPITGWSNAISALATWTPTRTGYRVKISVTELKGEVGLDLIVNEKPEGRERRRGQLVLSGGGGFVYLRGDRHDPNRLISIQLPDA